MGSLHPILVIVRVQCVLKKILNSLHLICNNRSVMTGHVFVLRISVLLLSTILIFDFGIVEAMLYFLFSLSICKIYTFILQSVHLLYKYAMRINVCFFRTRRIIFSAYKYTFLVPCSYVQRRAQTSMKLVLM